MSTITLSTRELHDLLTPVLPHASTDKTLPDLCTVRLEVRDNTLYAVATDRYTMAATRHRLQDLTDDTDITIGAEDAAALLKVFKFGRQVNPGLQLVVGTIQDETVLDPADRPALTVSAKDGNTLVLPGRENRTLTTWRKLMAKALHRDQKPADPHLVLTSTHLPRWMKALGPKSHLSLHAGSSTRDPIIVRAGDHFLAVWAPRRPDSEPRLEDSPWLKELPLDVDAVSGTSAQAGAA